MTTRTLTITVVGGNPSNHPYHNVGSSNKYAIDGSTATADVTLYLAEGGTYVFDQSDNTNSGHPLRFSTTANGTHSGGSEYTTGVTVSGVPGNSGAKTTIVVADSAPTLYYYCTNHSNMGWTANTVDATSWGVLSWGEGAWGDQNDISVSVTGVASTTAIGSVTIDAEIGEGWGRGTWGNRVWDGVYSVIPTGVSATSAIGTATASISFTASVTGVATTSAVGSVTTTQGVEITPTGQELTGSVGTVDFDGDASTGVTGVAMTSATGEAIVAPITLVDVTGVALTSAIGDVVLEMTGAVNVTGVATTSAVGSITPVSGYDVTGVAMTSAVGTVAEVTGTGTVDDVTGVALTTSVGSVIIIAWNRIDTGTPVVWTKITTAA